MTLMDICERNTAEVIMYTTVSRYTSSKKDYQDLLNVVCYITEVNDCIRNGESKSSILKKVMHDQRRFKEYSGRYCYINRLIKDLEKVNEDEQV